MQQTQVQIYTMQSVAEAEAVAALGVDHVGVTPAQRGLPGEITESLAAEICRALDATNATSVALTVDTDPNVIVHMTRTVRPDILHLCGPQGAIGPAEVARLRLDLPDTAVMQAIGVTGPDAIDVAQAYEPVADFLLLDSVSPDVEGVGAAGVTHDWGVSAAIVESVSIPAILAGGLSSGNVLDAIYAVRPWGVDSLTHTNRPTRSGGFRKDLDAVRSFAAIARGETA